MKDQNKKPAEPTAYPTMFGDTPVLVLVPEYTEDGSLSMFFREFYREALRVSLDYVTSDEPKPDTPKADKSTTTSAEAACECKMEDFEKEGATQTEVPASTSEDGVITSLKSLTINEN